MKSEHAQEQQQQVCYLLDRLHAQAVKNLSNFVPPFENSTVNNVIEIVVWFSFYLNSNIVCKLQGPPKYIIDTLSTSNESAHSEPFHIRPIYLLCIQYMLDVLRGQPIKLIHVVTS